MDLVSTAMALDALEPCADVDVDVDRALVTDALRLVMRLRRLVDAAEVRWNLRLDAVADADPSVSPEHVNADATQRSLGAATSAVNRARATLAVPELAAALAAGSISLDHVGAFVWALRSLDSSLRHHLLAMQPQLVDTARCTTVEEFKDRLAAEVRRIEGDDGAGRLRRQRAAISVRTWTDREGMWNLRGRFDPERAVALVEALRRATESVFHAAHPAEAPDDPVLRQRYLQALALESLMLGNGTSGSGVPTFIVTIDHDTLASGARHERSRVDCGSGIELPIESLLAMAGRAQFVPVLVDDDGVLVAMGRTVRTIGEIIAGLDHPTSVDHGRSRRHASRNQQRAIRAMYRRCGVLGCHTHVSRCEIHHVEFWERGGSTDLANLIPLCRHHHDRLHAEGWILEMGPDRSLVISKRDSVVMSTGPPVVQWA